jgi:hypothetical protein
VQNDGDSELLTGIGIDIEKTEACLSVVRAQTLVPAGRAFAKNIMDILMMLSLPLILLTRRPGAHHSVGFTIRALTKVEGYRKFEAPQSAVHTEVKRLWHEALEEGDLRKTLVEEATQELNEALKEAGISDSVRVLLTSSASATWTAFECLATDLWVASLDARPGSLAQRAIKSLEGGEQPDGISCKGIAVWQLAKHGFDLRDCMGRVLKPKFDLTSLSNIKEAYFAAFQERKQLDEVFSTQDLNLLEASRHVIVHRAGVVDDEFAKRTKAMGIDWPIGALLPLEGKVVSRFANAAVGAGCELLSFVDGWLTANPA